jgi:CBS domain-containing protein
MKVREIGEMTAVHVPHCLPSDTAPHAARILMEMGPGGIVPIVSNDADSQLIGVVTDRDLWLEIERRDSGHVRVADCPICFDICCSPEDEVEHAVDCMCEHEVVCIPVVDEEHRIQGMLSLAEVLRRAGPPAAKAFEALRKGQAS